MPRCTQRPTSAAARARACVRACAHTHSMPTPTLARSCACRPGTRAEPWPALVASVFRPAHDHHARFHQEENTHKHPPTHALSRTRSVPSPAQTLLHRLHARRGKMPRTPRMRRSTPPPCRAKARLRPHTNSRGQGGRAQRRACCTGGAAGGEHEPRGAAADAERTRCCHSGRACTCRGVFATAATERHAAGDTATCDGTGRVLLCAGRRHVCECPSPGHPRPMRLPPSCDGTSAQQATGALCGRCVHAGCSLERCATAAAVGACTRSGDGPRAAKTPRTRAAGGRLEPTLCVPVCVRACVCVCRFTGLGRRWRFRPQSCCAARSCRSGAPPAWRRHPQARQRCARGC